MKTRPCGSCGKTMIWAETENGKAIPLDAEPVNAFVLERKGTVLVAKMVKTYQTHFATCRNADQWRKM
jgi:hypothetical protein